ncbi:hypothetical protein ACJZ2D_007586 [Fusarium nematophilum]
MSEHLSDEVSELSDGSNAPECPTVRPFRFHSRPLAVRACTDFESRYKCGSSIVRLEQRLEDQEQLLQKQERAIEELKQQLEKVKRQIEDMDWQVEEAWQISEVFPHIRKAEYSDREE